jgi:hypothetical protein
MLKIFINSNVTSMAVEYSTKLFEKRQANFEKPAFRLSHLHASLLGYLPVQYCEYIEMVIRTYRLLNAVEPKKFLRLHQKFFTRFDHSVNLSAKIPLGGITKEFYKHIADAMRYDAVRDREFLPYAKKLGISSCVYCNANYALTIQFKKDTIGKFELDHYFPQSTYPYLCTNFYNLYPVCGNCNKYKLNKSPLFSLYSNDPVDILDFSFTLDKKSIIKYMLSQNYEDLRISFSAPKNLDHDEMFKIEATYSALKDVVEELVWKYKVYNPAYLMTLKNTFSKKFAQASLRRFILGNYDKPGDIHKRPLTKLTQDIARQLGILEFK